MKTESYAISRPMGSIREEKTSRGETYYDGHVLTAYGYVQVFSQSGPNFTSLHFGHNGHVWRGTKAKFYSARFLVTLADRFAKEIVGADA